ncbi:hypothetical protein HYPDE_29198 [Hyphomicrobium denitrificans 1NES1]|uniref:DUF2130 domain-containing protein n=1 Tax=Hyphomicrobium denitrificans 1NES1 TaxID=670307 RepID=N0BBN2_9HYPH|nr:DUF2130 domain-containing protein [Hyphomicrobium denitrificans]AGK57515.1 hypothetical protein HYPDE_29198 [Hyphomicrobium denitrificans 1NES1]
MSDPTITCPNCRTEIKLNESLAGPLIAATRQRYEKIIADKEQAIGAREAALRERQADIERQKASLEEQISARLKTERETIAAEEAQKAKLRTAGDIERKAKEIGELQEILKERDVKLAEAQKSQADLLRKQRELDDARRELDLTVEKKVQASLVAVRDKAKQDAEEGLKLRMAEKDQQMDGMRKQIEDLKRRAEQGSQQLQGEVLELELESLLRARFPRDVIEPVPKGEFGGDVLHRVIGSQNQICGTILWESKHTKNWSDSWLSKLREDQRSAKAEIALLISSALPKGVVAFDLIDGVWVAETRCALAVAVALRQSLIELSMARDAGEGQQTKVELVYQYLTGPRFRHRIEAVIEKISDMQADLERERKAMTRLWAKREAQIRGVIESTVGMYGDLQGIAGRSLQEIEGLDLKLLDGPAETSSDDTNDA